MSVYKEAAGIIERVQERKGSAKNLVLSSKHQRKKQLYALVCETVKYRSVLDDVIKATKLEKLERKALKSHSLTLVVLYDFLFGRGISSMGPTYKDAVLRHKAALQACVAQLKVKTGSASNSALLHSQIGEQVKLPRYVRVNVLKTSVAEVIQHFRRDDYMIQAVTGLKYNRYVEIIKKLKKRQFVQDPHIDELLVFAAGTDLHDHPLYVCGDIILQDKASCVPAAWLSPPPRSCVIDTCAAPGNKTTQLAAHLNNKGSLHAFERDSGRVGILSTQLLKAGARADIHHADFLRSDPSLPPLVRAQYLLVDPSCSGSGIVSRLGSVVDDKASSSAARLGKLAGFQATILSHALSFPNAEKVIYSTCSIHEEENENVVRDVLKSTKGKFVLEPVFPDWPSRGKDGIFPDAKRCLRLSPGCDATNGFFVACFVKNPNYKAVDDVKEEDLHPDKVSYCSDDDENDAAICRPQVQPVEKVKKTKVKKQKPDRKRDLAKAEVSSKTSTEVQKSSESVNTPNVSNKKAKQKRNKKGNGENNSVANQTNTSVSGVFLVPKNKDSKSKNKKQKRKHKPVTS